MEKKIEDDDDDDEREERERQQTQEHNRRYPHLSLSSCTSVENQVTFRYVFSSLNIFFQ